MKHLVLLLAFLSSQAYADDWKLRIACDAASSWLRIGDAEAPDFPSQSPSVQVNDVKWPNSRRSQTKSKWGNAFRIPGKPTIGHCGALKMILRSEYLNENPDGNLGLVEFVSVEVYRGKKLVVPKTGFYQCDTTRDQFEHFGKCPESYARTIEISRSSGQNAFSVVTHRRFENDALQVQEVVETHAAL